MPIYNVHIQEVITTTHQVEAESKSEAGAKGLEAFMRADAASYRGVNVEEREVDVEEVKS